jgi:hypothetical protein
MAHYSLDFLQADWSGAGYDFALAAVFSPSMMNSSSIRLFLQDMQDNAKVTSVKYLKSDGGGQWENGLRSEATSTLADLDWKEIELIVVTVTQMGGMPFRGYVEIAKPNHVLVGGPSEAFYSGSGEADMAVAISLSQRMAAAVRCFGPGHCAFGAGSQAINEACALYACGAGGNFCHPADILSHANNIRSKCLEMRMLE